MFPASRLRVAPLRFLYQCVFLSALVCASSGNLLAGPPNVVLILGDDQAWTDYGFMGHPEIETPHLDRLAARSAVFKRGYVPTGLCRPSLATIITGRYAHQHLITGNDPAPLGEPGDAKDAAKEPARKKTTGDSPEYAAQREQLIAHYDRQPALPKLLADAGYVSHQSGKWWEGSFARGGFTAGMTRGFPQSGGRHGDDGLVIGRETMQPVFEFINQSVADEKPFFVWYAPFLPHSPHNPPDRLFQKYKAKGVTSDHVARYYAMCEWFDETCGQLLDHVESKGQTGNTLVVYLADNGWIQREDNPNFAPRSKQTAYEGGVRQPILFSLPGKIRPGDRGEELCSSIDIAPTILGAAGIARPAGLPGYNLLPVLRSGEPTPRKRVFGETFAHDIPDLEHPAEGLVYRWMIEGRWKLLLTYDGHVGPRYESANPRSERRPQLFDLLADPHEQTNLAKDHPDRVRAMAADIAAWWPATGRTTQETWTDTP